MPPVPGSNSSPVGSRKPLPSVREDEDAAVQRVGYVHVAVRVDPDRCRRPHTVEGRAGQPGAEVRLAEDEVGDVAGETRCDIAGEAEDAVVLIVRDPEASVRVERHPCDESLVERAAETKAPRVRCTDAAPAVARIAGKIGLSPDAVRDRVAGERRAVAEDAMVVEVGHVQVAARRIDSHLRERAAFER